jgi:SPP1 family predicted phage head-tail adaptor
MPLQKRAQLNELGINPGQLRHRITLLEEVTAMGASGMVTTWAPADPPVQAWAHVEEKQTEEVLRGGQDVTQAHITVTIRYNPAFSTNKHVQVRGVEYIIQAIHDPLFVKAYMVMDCLGIGASA